MGSIVKPFVYLTALETKRYNASTVIQDEPIDVKLQNGTHWKPQNFTKEIYGPVPLVRALSESLNLATVGLGLDVGLPNITRTLQRFGLQKPPLEVPAMTLGAVEVTPLGSRPDLQWSCERRLSLTAARGARRHQRRRQAAEGVFRSK